MTEGLKDKQFFAFIMGFIIPVIYAWTLIYVGSLCLLRKIRFDHIFVVVLCVYGLGLYHYFIHRSGVTSYDAVCVPLVLVLCFWVQYICAMMPARFKSIIPIGLALWTFVALATGYLFTYYPNVLNLGGLNWTPERAFYQKEFNFTQDGTLVRNLTKPGEGAALISSFETKILMQANRRPFFYYFPLMESSLMDAPDVRGTYLHTQERVAKTLGQLQRQKPPYIFVETKLLGIAAQPSLKVLLDYVAAQYNSSGQSTHLTVYRRKD